MPVRRTQRGAARGSIAGEFDVLVCGASFAGLAVAHELAGADARVLVLDRYEIGERPTSACGIPTSWLEALDLTACERQRFGELVLNTPHRSARLRLPWTFSTFDYAGLCELLWRRCDARFETAKVDGRTRDVVHTDRGDVRAPLVVDALGWRRLLGRGVQPPDAPLSRGLEVHPGGAGDELAVWVDRSYVPAGYAWSFPAGDELRIGVGSFDPRFHVKRSTVRLASELGREPVRYQGNWIPHRLREATEDGVFFAGDSAGHCLPFTAEGIRTALYFGLACGRELRAVVEGRRTAAEALCSYADFSAAHGRAFSWLLRMQWLLPRLPPRSLPPLLRVLESERLLDWWFGHYLRIAPPEFAAAGARRRPGRAPRAAVAA